MKIHRIACLIALSLTFVAALAEGTMGHPITQLNLRAKPTTTSEVIAVLQPQDTVEIYQTRKGWYHVRVLSRKTGWVSRKFVMLAQLSTNERLQVINQADNSPYVHSSPMQTKAHHSMIHINKAVIAAFEGLARSLAADGISFDSFGDEYDKLKRLVIVFGPSASLADLRAIVKATGPSPDLYLATFDDFVNTITVGPYGGEGYKSAKLKDVYRALEGAGDIDDLAIEIAKKGKRQP